MRYLSLQTRQFNKCHRPLSYLSPGIIFLGFFYNFPKNLSPFGSILMKRMLK